MKRFFTSDFHLSMPEIIDYEHRPFKDIKQMNNALVQSCLDKTTCGDVVYHLGDLFSFNSQRTSNEKAFDILKPVEAMFINIRGNHDVNNRVKSVCESMRLHLSSKYPNVSLSHYPSYDQRSSRSYMEYDIHLCGHVHRRWKHCLDMTHNVLNINVGVDVWNFQIVSEDELMTYLDKLFKKDPNDIFKCRTNQSGNVEFFCST